MHEYKFVTHDDVDEALLAADVCGPVRVTATLTKFGVDGWRVIRFGQADYGLNFWALLERERRTDIP